MHPVLFEIPTPFGTLPVYSYGVMLGTSMIAAWYLVMYLGEKHEGLSRDLMGNTFIVTAIVAIVGSRVLYIVTNPDEFHDPARWFALRSGGLVAYGGFLGGLLGAWAYLRLKKASLLAWADVVAPTLGSGLALTRIGCYLYGCDFGARLGEDAPAWLVHLGTFPHWAADLEEGHGSPAWAHHVAEYDHSPLSEASLPVHPTQLYESAFGFLLFGIAMLVWRRRAFRGQVILVVAMLYGMWRFLIEYVRDDPERGFYFGFSTSQLISIALVPVCGFLYFELRKRGAPVLATATPAETPKPLPSPVATPEKAGARKKKRRKGA